MRISNPSFAAPAAPSATDKTDLQAALVALASNAAPTADELRAVLGAKASRFTDAQLEATARALGLNVTL